MSIIRLHRPQLGITLPNQVEDSVLLMTFFTSSHDMRAYLVSGMLSCLRSPSSQAARYEGHSVVHWSGGIFTFQNGISCDGLSCIMSITINLSIANNERFGSFTARALGEVSQWMVLHV